jgi:hypothetical protein
MEGSVAAWHVILDLLAQYAVIYELLSLSDHSSTLRSTGRIRSL